MFKRINILDIIKDHFKTLRRFDSSSNNIYWKDFVLFIIVPLIIGVLFSYNEFSIKPYIGNLIAAISIFGGFLFNLLAIIYSQIDKIKKDAYNENSLLKKTFVKEIHKYFLLNSFIYSYNSCTD
jgi:ACR3 family arsenite efflux pump ArsB